MVDDAPLPVVQAAGFSASVDAFAWEPDSDSANRRLWFISLLGPQQALKALWARLVRGEQVTLSQAALGKVYFCTLAPEGPKTWRSYTASLPGAGGHQLVLLPEAARHGAPRDDFLLLPRTEDEASLLHFRFLDRRLDLPLHRSWHAWLWERALRTGEATALEAAGILAYHCKPNPEALAVAVSAAVVRRQLRIAEESDEVRSPQRANGLRE